MIKRKKSVTEAKQTGTRKRFFFFFFLISWRLITLQYCSGFCHTLTWISHGFTCIPHPDPPSHFPLHAIPLTKERKRVFYLLWALHLSHKCSQPSFSKALTESTIYSKAECRGCRNLAIPLWKMHSFLSSVMAMWMHLSLERKLKLVWIKTNIHASSNKSTVYENVNDHLFIW